MCGVQENNNNNTCHYSLLHVSLQSVSFIGLRTIFFMVFDNDFVLQKDVQIEGGGGRGGVGMF